MWSSLYGLLDRINCRKNLKFCKRCDLFHSKQLAECPECTDVDDKQLEALLKQRAIFREGLEKGCGMVQWYFLY